MIRFKLIFEKRDFRTARHKNQVKPAFALDVSLLGDSHSLLLWKTGVGYL